MTRWSCLTSRIVLALVVLLPLVACASEDDASGSVEVPILIGSSFRDAQAQLANKGLRWRIADGERVFAKAPTGDSISTSDDDVVRSQEPAAGARVKPKSIVTVEIDCDLPEKALDPEGRCID